MLFHRKYICAAEERRYINTEKEAKEVNRKVKK